MNQYRDNERPKIRDLNVQRQYGHSGDIPPVPPQNIHQVAQRMNSVNDNPYVKEMEKSEGNAGYSSVQIDVYKNEITGEKVAYVYIPGTDFDNMSKKVSLDLLEIILAWLEIPLISQLIICHPITEW